MPFDFFTYTLRETTLLSLSESCFFFFFFFYFLQNWFGLVRWLCEGFGVGGVGVWAFRTTPSGGQVLIAREREAPLNMAFWKCLEGTMVICISRILAIGT